MTQAVGTCENNLLAALNPKDFALIQPKLEVFEVKSGDVLYHPGDNVRTVYFPCGPTLLAFRVLLDDGRVVEVALIGREGAVAGIVSQGRLPAFARAEVQFAGPIMRMELSDLEAAKSQSVSLRHLFARYADCVMAQVFQSVACNATHTIEQRAAKWLLAAMERTGDSRLPLTQEQLAEMLGIGRSYVSRVLQALKARGLIQTRRGVLVATDIDALSHVACNCHEAVKRHFDQVLKGVYPDQGTAN